MISSRKFFIALIFLVGILFLQGFFFSLEPEHDETFDPKGPVQQDNGLEVLQQTPKRIDPKDDLDHESVAAKNNKNDTKEESPQTKNDTKEILANGSDPSNLDSSIDWIRPSSTEIEQIKASNSKSCRQPFQHCCLGQCRQEMYKIDGNKALWKPVHSNSSNEKTQLHQLSDVLEYYGTTLKESGSKTTSCNLLFFGDSLSSDHSMGAVCQLIEDGYELKSCSTRIGGPPYGADRQFQCTENKYPTIPHFLFQNERRATCSEVLIINLRDITAFFQGTYFEWDGLFIFNWGVHCNDKNVTCISSALERVLSLAKDDQFRKWKFIYREHEPQHFNSNDGLYERVGLRFILNCSLFHGTTLDNWRNDAVVEILERHNLTAKVPVLPMFSSLGPLKQIHYNGVDCTHYCYNPLRFWVTWDGLYNVLKKINGS
mmetsp:Transcript_50994/g.75677  ORF Transcript_50994/g.75677 Transcript_50994/m.75677 type:complete len:429 (+) Transcript_50994:166-1452(+)|eukprot:CAMPEP_0195524964 /NCGR_PEP_ID=MMETSP0794_2-20130614/25102_1 /TAXON_ID=515487 /ORGANISM="Stephanopyxis turris, Strain CCMP 815" /LENGTH=428 /DNA_ID=CAMNT_0040655305 /DNA_START=86 /DNA_END=1372 /DNA_ORIENTATION=+